MDFTVNFMDRATVVLKEAVSLKKYKAMPLALAIITGIFMLPVALAGLVCTLFVYVLGYLFSVVSLPTDRLYKLLHGEGQSVKHATQTVVYLLSWGLVFGAYAMLSLFLIMLTIFYSAFSIFTYIWTLGGFKFHVFANDEDISTEVDGKYKIWMPVVFVSVMGGLLILIPLIQTVIAVVEASPYFKITFDMFLDIFKAAIQALSGWRFLFSAVYSAIIFAPNPKKKIEE